VITLNTRFEDYTRNTSKSIDTMNSSINGLSSEIEALKINEGRKDQRLVGIEGKLEKQGETLEKVHEKLNNLAIKIATGVGAGGGLVYAIVEAIKAWKA
jgi:archaellum component FlaC